jgi:peptidoglycan/xylan/chitin deacetylase (PgdA/CDA1 family)
VTTRPIPILCYHAVSDDPTGPLAPWSMTPQRFDEHLDALDAAGYRPVALDQREEPGAVVLTVDDGYDDHAWTRLAERGWPATLYVTTGFTGSTFHGRPMLDRGRIRELADAGITIGAHGHTHVALDAVAPEVARDEVHRSRDLLEAWTGRPVASFAYPHGFHDRRVRELVVDAGFRSACAVKQALSSTDDDPFALARIMPTGDVTAEALIERLRTAPVASGGREQLRTTAFRLVRRARHRVAA